MKKYMVFLLLFMIFSHSGVGQVFSFPCDKEKVGKSPFDSDKKTNTRDIVCTIDTNKVDFVFRYRSGDYNQLVLYHYKKNDTWRAFNYNFYDENGKKYKKYRLIVAHAKIKKNINYKQLWDSLIAHDVFIMPNTTLHLKPPTEMEKNMSASIADGDVGHRFELITKNCYHTYIYSDWQLVGGMYHTADVIQFMKMMQFLEKIKDPKSASFLKQ